jgi:hypothetical protein
MYAKKSLGLFVLVFALPLFVQPATASGETNSLTLDKTVFAPRESINVRFTASSEFPASAWVGIIPSYVAHGSEVTNDQNDIQYYHLNNQTSGVMTFSAPDQPGTYDLRMNDTDDASQNGHEVASVTFSVATAANVSPVQVPDVVPNIDLPNLPPLPVFPAG